MRNYKKLPVWQNGIEIAVRVHRLGESLFEKGKYDYAEQIYQAAVAVSSNIAVGSSYESDAEYRGFLRQSLGACFQLETLLLVVLKLDIIDDQEMNRLTDLLEDEKRLLKDLMRQLIWRED